MITRRMHMFVREYLADPQRNATQAARRAGYSKSSAPAHSCRMLQDPEVQELINKELTRHLEKLDVDAQLVLKGIMDTIEDAKHSGRGAWQSATILRGYELLGRSLGLFHDKIDVNAADNALIDALKRGRERAAGLLQEEEEEAPEAEEKPAEEQKPN
jgi:phage terminase small subunit